MNNYNFKYDTPAFKAFRTTIIKCLAEIEYNADSLNSSQNQGYLHQLRVALRKLATLFQSLAKLSPELKNDKLFLNFKKQIKQRLFELGKVRDLEVFSTSLSVASFLNDTYQKVHIDAMNKTASSYEHLIKIVQHSEYRKFWEEIKNWVNTKSYIQDALISDKPIGELSDKLLKKQHKKLLRYFATNISAMPALQLHKLRIFIKEYHYLLFFFGHLYPVLSETNFLKTLQKIQDTLGIIHDFTSTKVLINELLGVNASDSEYTFILGEIYGRQAYKTQQITLKLNKQFNWTLALLN